MLTALRGKTHEVLTGVVVRCGDAEYVDCQRTTVAMNDASNAAIRDYIRTGEPMDKAGAYAIQGAGGALIAGIDGCLDNVIGLPLCVVSRLLRRCGLELPSGEEICRHYHVAQGWPVE